LKFSFLHPDWVAQNSTKTTHKITHQELFSSGFESGPKHHLPKIEMVMQHRQISFFKQIKPYGAFFVSGAKPPLPVE
jgi:hypothetical protein